jgi:ubiquinone/menaquinone biosynthesis C-methylase UbiE
MNHFINIYHNRADDYQRMMEFEDVEGNLVGALERVSSVAGKRVLDLGTGTGRLPVMLADQTKQMVGLDLHRGMLREHQRQQAQQNDLWGLVQGDMRLLPFPSDWADVVTAGWAIGHFVGWYGDDWQTQIGRVLSEMQRLVRPDGSLIIIETLTTGSMEPAPPNQGLATYYAWLESEWGFQRQQIRTDYQFDSVDEAVTRTEFFFGPELAATVREKGWARIPEWTGVWAKQI